MNKPLAASVAPDSDPGPAPLNTNQPPEDLILPAAEIFETDRIRAELSEAVADLRDAMAIRKAAVALLGAAYQDGRAAIAKAFQAKPFDARPTQRAYCWLTDQIVLCVLEVAQTRLHMNPTPTDGERLATIAVGGYGRSEMAPFSDVDLLFVTPYKITPWAESVIESSLYMMWDLKLKVGHASRTVKDCLRLAKEDYTIRTSLVEMRHLAGDDSLTDTLSDRLQKDLFQSTAAEFIEAKLNEREARHIKQGGQRYMVEPNVKEGKGGLRDLQSLYWIGKYIHGVHDASELVSHNVFSADEYQTFREAHDFLSAVRCHLHLIAGRAVDQLSFDMQVAVAEAMNYRDTAGRRAVEVFMQAYFRHATSVGDLTRIFLTAQERAQTKSSPLLHRIFGRRQTVESPYAIKHNRITVSAPKKFLSDKLNLLRLFEKGLTTGTLIHPDAMRLVAANLDLIDDDMRDSKEAAKLFLGLMLKHGNPERALRRMNELGVLSAYYTSLELINT